MPFKASIIFDKIPPHSTGIKISQGSPYSMGSFIDMIEKIPNRELSPNQFALKTKIIEEFEYILMEERERVAE